MVNGIIIIAIVLTAMLVLVASFSIYYRKERIRLEKALGDKIALRIENIRTVGQERQGWKNNFPSALGWEKTTLQVSEDFILVTGRSAFPFLFKSEIQPLIIAMNPGKVMAMVGFDRIYRPLWVRTTNNGNHLEVSIRPTGALGEINVCLTFENIGRRDMSRLFEITKWPSNAAEIIGF